MTRSENKIRLNLSQFFSVNFRSQLNVIFIKYIIFMLFLKYFVIGLTISISESTNVKINSFFILILKITEYWHLSIKKN